MINHYFPFGQACNILSAKTVRVLLIKVLEYIDPPFTRLYKDFGVSINEMEFARSAEFKYFGACRVLPIPRRCRWVKVYMAFTQQKCHARA
jgi:hypothetical protein